MQLISHSNVDQWSNHIRSVCGDFKAVFNRQQQLFIGEVDLCLLGQTEVAFIKTNAEHIIRKPGIRDRVNNTYCFLILQHQGNMQITYKNEVIKLNEGDIILLDPEQQIEMQPQGLFSHISVHLSREKLIQADIHDQYWGKLNTLNMSGHLLKTLMQSVSKQHINLWHAMQDGAAFEDALIALIKPTIHYCTPSQLPMHYEQAERYILENLSHPTLCPLQISQHLNISLRHLHRLFSEQNYSITQFILNARLERIKQDLQNHCFKDQSITEIALKWGFCDSAHFSKKFKQHYGVSPRTFRSNLFTH